MSRTLLPFHTFRIQKVTMTTVCISLSLVWGIFDGWPLAMHLIGALLRVRARFYAYRSATARYADSAAATSRPRRGDVLETSRRNDIHNPGASVIHRKRL